MSFKQFRVNKLIRDNIPNILKSKKINLQEKVLDHSEYLCSLKEKLQEEVDEAKNTTNIQDLKEEMADVLEVLHSMCMAHGFSFIEIEESRIKKRNEKGGFDKKIYVETMEIEEKNPIIEFYRQKKNHYPEIIKESDCIFCKMFHGEREIKIFARFKHCFVIMDQFPVSKGHLLIIPNEHTENWFTARDEVRLDMIKALNIIKEQLDADYNPQGYNIGANCGKVAGQSVMHLHLHLIPRYEGDMDDPKGGVRGVIPSKQKY